MKHSTVVVAGIAILASGCGPSVRSASFATFPPRPQGQTVQLFSTKRPACPYGEVGLVRIDQGFGPKTSLEDMLEALRKRAGEMGGDAVVGLGQTQQVEGGGLPGEAVSVSTKDGLAGTVIRYTEEGCRQ